MSRVIESECPDSGLSIDVGSGPGESHRYFNNAVVGIDLQTNFRPAAQASAESLPFADNAFSFGTSFQCYYYVEDIDTALSELNRVLRPGARVLLSLSSLGALRRGEARIRAIPQLRASGNWLALFFTHGFQAEVVSMPGRYSGPLSVLANGCARILTPYEFYWLTKPGDEEHGTAAILPSYDGTRTTGTVP